VSSLRTIRDGDPGKGTKEERNKRKSEKIREIREKREGQRLLSRAKIPLLFPYSDEYYDEYSHEYSENEYSDDEYSGEYSDECSDECSGKYPDECSDSAEWIRERRSAAQRGQRSTLKPCATVNRESPESEGVNKKSIGVKRVNGD
jgi:hypothetical protein